jgi:hypothetical protein
LAILPLYVKRPGRELHSLPDLKRVLTDRRPAIVVFHKRTWQELGPLLPARAALESEFTIGHKRLVWVSFP